MSSFTRAEDGYEFAITELGQKNPIIADKFLGKPLYHKERYKKSVPTAWLVSKQVKLVKKQGGD